MPRRTAATAHHIDHPGLSESTARQRLVDDGLNSLPTPRRHGLLAIAWEVVREPMFLLLVSAGCLYLIMGEKSDAALLLGFVIVVMGITIVQERRTERALQALRDLSSPKSLVIRNGQRQRIAATGLVRGDLIVLAEGERVPADALLRSDSPLMLDESLLTGESVPVTKSSSVTPAMPERPGGEALHTLYSGTLVTSGQGLAEVVATGPRSQLGRIGMALGHITPERTRLQRETSGVVRILAIIGLCLCAAVVALYSLTRGGDLDKWKEGLLAGIAMAMSVLPEELPVILTIFLALGAWRISQRKVLTRRLPAIETLGSATVLCTDKTGTLTRNQMTVARIIIGEREFALPDPPIEQPAEVLALLDICVLASRPDPFDPMERALHLASASASPTAAAAKRDWTMEREYLLAPELLAVSHAWRTGPETPLLIASKGAPEAIAKLCGLSHERREALMHQVATLAEDGLRVLGVARGEIHEAALPEQQRDLQLNLVGLIALADPLRSTVAAAVAECQAAGIRVIMITGDHQATACSIARQAGIRHAHEVVTGAALQAMSTEELARRIGTVGIFARVAPEQKLRIVQALMASGEVVAMIGDGVNDAPALKAADIGIAMGGRGSDVAREAAALVLLDDDFAAIVAAIHIGRRIFDNIRKAIAFTFAVHVPIAGLCILPVLDPNWPILLMPVHIVFLEMVINPVCALIFEAEPAEEDIMDRPPRSRGEKLFAWRSIAPSLLQGFCALAICIGIFVYARIDHGDDAARALTFAALVSSVIAIIFTNRSWSKSLVTVLRTRNPALWPVVLVASGVLAVVLSLPIARTLFHFAPLHGIDLVLSISAALLCVGWIEIVKAVRWSHPNWGQHIHAQLPTVGSPAAPGDGPDVSG